MPFLGVRLFGLDSILFILVPLAFGYGVSTPYAIALAACFWAAPLPGMPAPFSDLVKFVLAGLDILGQPVGPFRFCPGLFPRFWLIAQLVGLALFLLGESLLETLHLGLQG